MITIDAKEPENGGLNGPVVVLLLPVLHIFF